MDTTLLRFRNKKFRIMQIADVQELTRVSPDTVKLITLAVKKEKPDLAVFTGDQIYGLMPCFRGGNTEEKVKNTLTQLLTPLEEAGIPFAVTFGNHDRQCGISNREQAKLYDTFPHFVKGEYRSEEDRGTAFIPLYNAGGEKIFHVCLFDSNGDGKNGGYQPVFPEQLNWYKEKCAAEKEKTGRILPQLVFQHIPVPEFYEVLRKCSRFTKGRVQAYRTHRNEFYVLPEFMRQRGDFMREFPAVPDENTGEFRILKEVGAALALAVGHDHNNSFTANLNGMALIYTQGAGFHVYGPGVCRGVRIFELNEDDLTHFSTHTLTYRELTDDKPAEPLLEFALTHIPTSTEQIKPYSAIGAVGLALIGMATGYLLFGRKKI